VKHASEVRPGDARTACFYEYARESPVLRKGGLLSVLELEPSIQALTLMSIGASLKPEAERAKFLRVPWNEMLKELRPGHLVRKSAAYIEERTRVQPEPGTIVVRIDLRAPKTDILKKISEICDQYQPDLRATVLTDRTRDWVARLSWLEMYRLRRSGLSCRKVGKRLGYQGNTTIIEREIRRGIAKVPKIFSALFPTLPPLPELKR
jgi:hypothetical protein